MDEPMSDYDQSGAGEQEDKQQQNKDNALEPAAALQQQQLVNVQDVGPAGEVEEPVNDVSDGLGAVGAADEEEVISEGFQEAGLQADLDVDNTAASLEVSHPFPPAGQQVMEPGAASRGLAAGFEDAGSMAAAVRAGLMEAGDDEVVAGERRWGVRLMRWLQVRGGGECR